MLSIFHVTLPTFFAPLPTQVRACQFAAASTLTMGASQLEDEKEELRTSAGKAPAEDHDDFVARRLSVAHLDFGDDADES